MTYADYCLQFEQIDYYSKKETHGFERHHLTPRAVQIEKYGRVIDDTCILVTKEQHIEAHRIFNIEFPLCKSQEVAYQFMINCKGTLGMPNPMKGKHHSEESKQKMSEAKRGKPSPKKGKTLSEETKRRIKKNHADMSGEKNPNYGKHHSEEARRRISEAHKGVKRAPFSEEWKQRIKENHADMKGENNPNYGKRMYNNGVENHCYIPGTEPKGYTLGMLKKGETYDI